jgi:hypothetical protein
VFTILLVHLCEVVSDQGQQVLSERGPGLGFVQQGAQVGGLHTSSRTGPYRCSKTVSRVSPMPLMTYPPPA